MIHAVLLGIAILLFAVGGAFFLVGGLIAGINLLRMSARLKSFANAPIWLKLNPTNALFYPQHLDAQGLLLRSRVMLWFKIAVSGLVAVFVASFIDQQLPPLGP